VQIGFGKDAFIQAAADRRKPECSAYIKRQVAEAVSEGKQGFDCGKDAVASRRRAGQGIGKTLEVGKRDGGERLRHRCLEAFGVGPVGALGVRRAAVEPDVDQLSVGGRLNGIRPGNRDFRAHQGQRSTKPYRAREKTHNIWPHRSSIRRTSVRLPACASSTK